MSRKRKSKSSSQKRPKPPVVTVADPVVPCQLYLITPPVIEDLQAFELDLILALSAGVNCEPQQPIACVQIRLKDASDEDIIAAAGPIVEQCHEYGALVIINDRPDLVGPCGADGAHIGQEDMDYYSSRELLGTDAILGVTCHNSKDLAFKAADAGADYVAFGAFFETQTKMPKARADVEILEWWNQAVEVPCVAIGGINPSNAKAVIEAGADFIAVSSGVWDHPDGPAEAVRQLSALCLEASPQ
ncbi:MAG: thiamine phosphate synthase [Maricaulaceae bacterium]